MSSSGAALARCRLLSSHDPPVPVVYSVGGKARQIDAKLQYICLPQPTARLFNMGKLICGQEGNCVKTLSKLLLFVKIYHIQHLYIAYKCLLYEQLRKRSPISCSTNKSESYTIDLCSNCHESISIKSIERQLTPHYIGKKFWTTTMLFDDG